MAKKGKLFKKGVAYVVEKAVSKVQASRDIWAEATAEGFRVNWNAWMSFVEPQLRATVARLPPKTTDIRTNVANRVVPVASLISRASQAYRAQRVIGVAVPAVPAPVPAPVPRI